VSPLALPGNHVPTHQQGCRELAVPLHSTQAGGRVRPAPLSAATDQPKEAAMLWTLFVILLVLWILGMVSSYTLGGFIHILLVIAVAVVLIRIIQGRRPV
jgi:hypothetical protein